MPDNLERSLSDYTQDRPRRQNQISGLLGMTPAVIQVPNRSGYVFVRLRNNTSELIQAWNENVAVVYGLPVLVEWNGNRYVVVGRDTERYAPAGFGWGSEDPYLPIHGSQHSFAPELGFGGDVTWVYSRQIMPFATTPSGTNGSPVVWIQPHVYRNPTDASWEWVGDDVSPDLLPANPTGTFGRMVLLCWNLDTDSVLVITGSYHSPGLTGTFDLLPYIPVVTNTQYVPLSAIRLVSGTTGIGWDNIYDMRQWATTMPPVAGGGGSSIDTIGVAGLDEGIPLGTGTAINWVGAGVTVTRSGTMFNVNIPGGGGSINTGTLDSRYLLLDTSNDPLTGELDIVPPEFYPGVYIRSTNTLDISLDHIVNSPSTDPAVYVDRYSTGTPGEYLEAAYHVRDDVRSAQFRQGTIRHVFYSGSSPYQPVTIAEINPYGITGSVLLLNSVNQIPSANPYLLLKNKGTEVFQVNASGTATSNGVPLIKEAPINSLPYVRRNAGWELASTGTVSGGGGGSSGDTPVIYDDSVFVATGTKISFNTNLTVVATGTSVFVTSPITTYFRVGVPTQLAENFFQVPDRVYASGSLGVFNNGMVLVPEVDYVEQLWVSGTYQYTSTRTGTHVVHYGVPCSPQTQPPTGTAGGSPFDLQDSDSVLLNDSDNVQLLDSDGA